MLVLRTVTNTGSPLQGADGTILSEVEISFQLYSPLGNSVDAWDAITGERIVATKLTAITDEDGIFSIPLWPTSRATTELYYLCETDYPGIPDFFAPLIDGVGPISWASFRASGRALTPAQQSALALHTQNTTIHLTTSEKALVDRLGVTNGVLTFDGIPIGSYTPTAIDPIIVDGPTGIFYRLVMVDGELLKEETLVPASSDLIIEDEVTHIFYKLVIENGQLEKEESAEIVATTFTLTDIETTTPYKLIFVDGELQKEEV